MDGQAYRTELADGHLAHRGDSLAGWLLPRHARSPAPFLFAERPAFRNRSMGGVLEKPFQPPTCRAAVVMAAQILPSSPSQSHRIRGQAHLRPRESTAQTTRRSLRGVALSRTHSRPPLVGTTSTSSVTSYTSTSSVILPLCLSESESVRKIGRRGSRPYHSLCMFPQPGPFQTRLRVTCL
jgi:hypothetical protein